MGSGGQVPEVLSSAALVSEFIQFLRPEAYSRLAKRIMGMTDTDYEAWIANHRAHCDECGTND